MLMVGPFNPLTAAIDYVTENARLRQEAAELTSANAKLVIENRRLVEENRRLRGERSKARTRIDALAEGVRAFLKANR
jgi:predicted nuclease with TOPRIM domain